MFIIQGITSNAKQVQTIVLPDGSSFVMNIYFSLLQQGWFMTSLVYGSFTLNGIRITNSPNFLNQFRNQIPFGLACYSTDNREPMIQQDFSSGASTLYLLTQAETHQYAEFLSVGT